MNGKYRCYLILLVAVVLLAALPVVTAWAQCPGPKLYVGGPVTKSTAVRGSQENPAKDMGEALDICQECPNGAYIYQYSTAEAKYVFKKARCIPEESEPTGVPLAQSVGMVLLGLLAVGLLAWGIHLRIKLRQFQSGS